MVHGGREHQGLVISDIRNFARQIDLAETFADSGERESAIHYLHAAATLTCAGPRP